MLVLPRLAAETNREGAALPPPAPSRPPGPQPLPTAPRDRGAWAPKGELGRLSARGVPDVDSGICPRCAEVGQHQGVRTVALVRGWGL
jgi:hypothetical protein